MLAINVKTQTKECKPLFISDFPVDEISINGGIEASTWLLVNSLYTLYGIRSIILAPDPRAQADSIEIHDFGSTYRIRISGLPNQKIETVNKYTRLLSESADFNIVHLQGYASYKSPPGIPRVLTIHGVPEATSKHEKNFLRKILKYHLDLKPEIRARNLESNIILISNYLKSIISDGSEKKYWRINNPVSPIFFRAADNKKSKRMIFVGRITAVKDLENLFRGFRIFLDIDDSYQLLIVGPGLGTKYGKRAQMLASKLGLHPNLVFAGNLTQEEIALEFSKSAFLVLSSRQETAPMVIGEALAMGLPVLATNVGGVAEMVEEPTAGMIVPPSDPVALARGMDILSKSNTNFSQNAIDASRFYSHNFVAKEVFEVYKQILDC